MDLLIIYLAAINVVTLLAFAMDHLICTWKPQLEDTVAHSLVLGVFPVAGGAVGMLLALLISTCSGRGRRMNKHNVAWWFLAIVCLIVWGLVVITRVGLVSVDTSVDGIVSGWHQDRLMVLGIYLAIVNVITFVVFAWDKHVALGGNDLRRRVPEARLLGLCLIGGSVGGMLAMRMVRHKTQKRYFAWGLPCFVILHVALLVFAHLCGLI